MWNRALLKQNAKDALRGRYWRSFLVCLVLAFLGVGSTAGNAAGSGVRRDVQEYYNAYGFNGLSDRVIGLISVTMLLVCLLALAWVFFVVNPLDVGRSRYFMENRSGATPYATVWSVFQGSYLNVVKVQALTALKIMLGSILIIPGIYWAYCYTLVPYLLAENPTLSAGRAMELSKNMMYGDKWNYFVLQTSFIGWALLAVLTFGIGGFFLQPSLQATYAEFYAAMRAKAFAANLTDPNELAGFVDRGMC